MFPELTAVAVGAGMWHGRRKVRGIVAMGVLLIGGAGVAVAAAGDLPQQPVLTTKAFDAAAGASGNYLVFEQVPIGGLFAQNAYLRHGSTTIRLNAANTNGWAGIDGNTVVYQQASRSKNVSGLRLYNVATKVRSVPPPGFNTAWWEDTPTISGNWILFGRSSVPNFRRNEVILRNRVTGKQVILANMVNKTSSFQNHVDPGGPVPFSGLHGVR